MAHGFEEPSKTDIQAIQAIGGELAANPEAETGFAAFDRQVLEGSLPFLAGEQIKSAVLAGIQIKKDNEAAEVRGEPLRSEWSHEEEDNNPERSALDVRGRQITHSLWETFLGMEQKDNGKGVPTVRRGRTWSMGYRLGPVRSEAINSLFGIDGGNTGIATVEYDIDFEGGAPDKEKLLSLPTVGEAAVRALVLEQPGANAKMAIDHITNMRAQARNSLETRTARLELVHDVAVATKPRRSVLIRALSRAVQTQMGNYEKISSRAKLTIENENPQTRNQQYVEVIFDADEPAQHIMVSRIGDKLPPSTEQMTELEQLVGALVQAETQRHQ